MLERDGLGRKPHPLAALERRVGGVQILEENAPGHAIDHQMMADQQQPLLLPKLLLPKLLLPKLLLPKIEQGGAQQRPGRQIEAGLQPIGMLRQCGGLRRGLKRRQINVCKRNRAVPVRMRLLPAAVRAAEA